MAKHNTEITSLIAQSVIDMVAQNGTDMQAQFGTREKFTEFVFSLSIKMVQSVLACDFKMAFDIVMGDGEFDALAKAAYAKLHAA